jgi:hypothetical protein
MGVHMKLVKMPGKISAIAAAAAAAVTMWSGGTAHAQTATWGEIRPVANGIIVQPLFTPECLALNAGDGFYNDHTRVFQWNCNGHDDQQWETLSAGSAANGHALYQVVNKQSGKCMEFRDSTFSNGNQIDQITCGTGGAKELWEIPYAYNSNYHEMHPYLSIVTGIRMCLDVRGGLPYDGTMVELWTCNGGTNQQFAGAPLYLLFLRPPMVIDVALTARTDRWAW